MMKRIAKGLLSLSELVICYSGVADVTWPKGVKMFYDADAFEAALNDPKNFGAHVMIDESAILYDEARSRKNYPAINRIASAGRHKGFTCYFSTQHSKSIPPIVRNNCGEVYVFAVSGDDNAEHIEKFCSNVSVGGERMRDFIVRQKPLEYVRYDVGEFKTYLGRL